MQLFAWLVTNMASHRTSLPVTVQFAKFHDRSLYSKRHSSTQQVASAHVETWHAYGSTAAPKTQLPEGKPVKRWVLEDSPALTNGCSMKQWYSRDREHTTCGKRVILQFGWGSPWWLLCSCCTKAHGRPLLCESTLFRLRHCWRYCKIPQGVRML